MIPAIRDRSPPEAGEPPAGRDNRPHRRPFDGRLSPVPCPRRRPVARLKSGRRACRRLGTRESRKKGVPRSTRLMR